MLSIIFKTLARGAVLPLMAAVCCGMADTIVRKFSFVPSLASGAVGIAPNQPYTRDLGFGFEPEYLPIATSVGIVGEPSFFFSVALPDGNYRVTVVWRGAKGGGIATVKAELRRLMLGPMKILPGAHVTRSFVVNVRSPSILAVNGVSLGKVDLKAPRETVEEAWAWDDRLTLEFNGMGAMVASVEIAPVDVPCVFLLGDSTVCDQPVEPFMSWGQALTRMMDDGIVVANHAESGESYRDSLERRRIDKIVSVMRPGDWVLMQFGHNDQKQIPNGSGGPFTTYKEEMKQHISMVKKAQGIPVIISPVERRRIEDKKLVATLKDYAEASRQVAAEMGEAFIDLNAMSKQLYEAMGPVTSIMAFASPEGKVDNTHHNAFGAWQLARCVTAAGHTQGLGWAKHLLPEFLEFDPARPYAGEVEPIPPSPVVTKRRSLGN